jgi:hypothetical protein
MQQRVLANNPEDIRQNCPFEQEDGKDVKKECRKNPEHSSDVKVPDVYFAIFFLFFEQEFGDQITAHDKKYPYSKMSEARNIIDEDFMIGSKFGGSLKCVRNQYHDDKSPSYSVKAFYPILP